MQCIPTKEDAGSGPRRHRESLSLAVELKLVLRVEDGLILRRFCKKFIITCKNAKSKMQSFAVLVMQGALNL
jgi:hypothetical protein